MAVRLEQLRYLDAVARHGSFRRAAAALAVSQPTISQQVRRLEEELDTVLLVRSRSGAIMTSAGQAILRHARATLAAEERLRQEAAAIAGLSQGRLRVGSISIASNTLLVDALRELRTAHPGIECQVTEAGSAEVEHQVREGLLDLGLVGRVVGSDRGGPADDSRLVAERLVHAPLLACLPADHPLVEAAVIDPAELADSPLIVYPPGYALQRAALMALGDGIGEPAFTINNIDTAVLIAEAGLGVALVPALAALAERSRQARVAFRPLAHAPVIEVLMVRRADELTAPAGSVVIQLLRRAAGDWKRRSEAAAAEAEPRLRTGSAAARSGS
ncbi:MAG: LysR family transcriptional regulator [Solirubrobacteraceae bacterium]